MDKGSIHLDGLSRAIMSLNDENNTPWYEATPSGVFYNTTDFTVGATEHPNSSFFGNTFTLQGPGPAVILRNTSNVTLGADKSLGVKDQDWYLGSEVTGGFSKDFIVGKFNANNDITKYLHISDTGAIGIGQSAQSEFKLAIAGGAFINGDSFINGTFIGPSYK